jgi:hypothetical protein
VLFYHILRENGKNVDGTDVKLPAHPASGGTGLPGKEISL